MQPRRGRGCLEAAYLASLDSHWMSWMLFDEDPDINSDGHFGHIKKTILG
jgi:hypothetical protein